MQIARTFVATFAFSACIYTANFRGNVLSGEKRRNILFNLDFTFVQRCAPALLLDRGYFAYRILSRICTNAIYLSFIRHIR